MADLRQEHNHLFTEQDIISRHARPGNIYGYKVNRYLEALFRIMRDVGSLVKAYGDSSFSNYMSLW